MRSSDVFHTRTRYISLSALSNCACVVVAQTNWSRRRNGIATEGDFYLWRVSSPQQQRQHPLQLCVTLTPLLLTHSLFYSLSVSNRLSVTLTEYDSQKLLAPILLLFYYVIAWKYFIRTHFTAAFHPPPPATLPHCFKSPSYIQSVVYRKHFILYTWSLTTTEIRWN